MASFRGNRRWQLSSPLRFFTVLAALASLGSLSVVLALPAPAAEQGAPQPGGLAEPLGPESAYQTQALSPSAIPVLPGTWVQEGPAPIEDGPATASPKNEVAGAIEAVAAHPTDANIIYVGTVNGGIWKTTNGTLDSPKWSAQTDEQRSLSIGALKFDRADTTSNTLIAGVGRFSAFRRAGGPRTGLLLTSNGGKTWRAIDGGGTLKGINISGVAMHGSTILATADTADILDCHHIGIFRSADGGKDFSLVSGKAGTGLPSGRVFDIAEDPGDTAVLYAPVQSQPYAYCNERASGVYKSTDAGVTWSIVSDAAINALFNNTMQVCLIAAGANNNVYVGIVNSVRLAGLFHSTNGGRTWVSLDLPQINSFSSIHFSIVADAKNPSVVYVGGQQSSKGAILYRVDSTKARGSQAETLTNEGTARNTAPHADSRGMAFDANGNLLEVDDGGIYRRTSPENNTGDWYSIVGNLQVTELIVLAFDRNSGIIFGGAQDNGALVQASTGSARWIDVITGDSGDVDVDVTSRAPNSVRYLSIQSLFGFRRAYYSPRNVYLGDDEPQLRVIGGGAKLIPQGLTPVRVNTINSRRIVIGGQNAVYESADQGDTITELRPLIRANNPNTIVYGGSHGTNRPDADLLYVGAGSALYKRTAPPPAALTHVMTYPGKATIVGIAVNQVDFTRVYVADASNVFFSTDGGTSWSNITGDLATFGVGPIESIVFLFTPIVGTTEGVFTAFPSLGLGWHQMGTGLPHAPAYSLYVDQAKGVLFAALLGRGAWRLPLTVQRNAYGDSY